MAIDSKNLKLARITEAGHSAFMESTPASGSVYFDEEEKTIRVGDGETAGGVAMATGGAVDDGIGAVAESVSEVEQSLLERIAADSIRRPSFYVGKICAPQTGNANWANNVSVEDVMPDPFVEGRIFINSIGAGDVDGILSQADWDGEKYAITATGSGLNHQGNSLYRPTAASPIKFFGYHVNPHKVTLLSWTGVAGAAATQEREFDIIPDGYIKNASSVTRTGFSEVIYTAPTTCVSPDQKKLLVRAVRSSDTKVCFLLFDIPGLLSGSTTCEKVIVEPDWSEWDFSVSGKYDISRQSVAFDGRLIYCLDSHTGYTRHYIRVIDLDGKKVLERPSSVEGCDVDPGLRTYEGESIVWGKNRSGQIALMFAVQCTDGMTSSDTTFKRVHLFDISSGGSADRFMSMQNGFKWGRTSASVTSGYTAILDSEKPLRLGGTGSAGTSAYMVVGYGSVTSGADAVPVLYPLDHAGTSSLGTWYYPWGNVTTKKLTIGSTTLSEAQLQSLLALI